MEKPVRSPMVPPMRPSWASRVTLGKKKLLEGTVPSLVQNQALPWHPFQLYRRWMCQNGSQRTPTQLPWWLMLEKNLCNSIVQHWLTLVCIPTLRKLKIRNNLAFVVVVEVGQPSEFFEHHLLCCRWLFICKANICIESRARSFASKALSWDPTIAGIIHWTTDVDVLNRNYHTL